MRLGFRLLVASMILGAVFASGWWAHAQPRITPPVFPQAPQVPQTTIISGADIGFQVDTMRSRSTGTLYGKWVVRVNGEWAEPHTATGRFLAEK